LLFSLFPYKSRENLVKEEIYVRGGEKSEIEEGRREWSSEAM
jgi:hypothetical protein